MNATIFAMLQTPEIIGLLVLALIFFGAKKLPELARGLGSGIKEFRKATRDVQDEIQSAIESDPSPSRRPLPPVESEPTTPGTAASAMAVADDIEPMSSTGIPSTSLGDKES